MSERIMKALANCEQGLTEEQKLQARTNIGAIGGVRVQDTSGTTDLVPDEQGRVTVDLTDAGKVQSDWDETNDAEPSYIRNKPDLSQFATKDELDGKQDVLEAGDNIIIEGNTISATAEPQQQADWAQTDTEAVDYIKNKPIIPAAQVQSDWSQSDSSAVDYIKNKPNLATVATSGSYDDLSDKPTIPPAQVQSDWAQTNTSAVDYIKNKPTIPASQVQSDWTETDTSDPAYIKHKPTLSSVATSGSYNDLSDKPSIPAAQVQSDWSQTNSQAVDYIKNKPTIPAAQVQSDWAQTNTSAADYIKNKPAAMETKPLVAGTNIQFVQETNAVRINATIPNAVVVYSGSPQMSQDQMDAIRSIVNANGTATILYGSAGGATYWDLIKYDSSGYDFGHIYGETVAVMHVTQSGYVSTTRYPLGGPRAYFLGSADWYDNITLSGQSSGTHLVNHATALPNPITLYSGKNYLITGNCTGSAEWTTTETTDQTKRFGIYLALTKSDYSITYGECVNVGRAQFYFHTDKGSRTPGYHFNVAIQGVTSVISPASTITLTNVVTYNSGNVVACSSGNTTKLYTDFDLGNLVVQEIS